MRTYIMLCRQIVQGRVAVYPVLDEINAALQAALRREAERDINKQYYLAPSELYDRHPERATEIVRRAEAWELACKEIKEI